MGSSRRSLPVTCFALLQRLEIIFDLKLELLPGSDFQRADFVQATLMTSSFKGRFQPHGNNLSGCFRFGPPAGENQDVGIVVKTAQARRLGVKTNGSADSRKFVGNNGHAYT